MTKDKIDRIDKKLTRDFVNEILFELAPCLIDGHTAETAIIIHNEAAYRVINQSGRSFTEPISLKLCARCGVVYEEKAK